MEIIETGREGEGLWGCSLMIAGGIRVRRKIDDSI